MNDKMIDVFGYIGSSLVSINLIPQIITIIKNKSGENISNTTCIINIIACGFMLFYGYSKQLIPIIICNGLILISSIIILSLKKYYIIINYPIIRNNTLDNKLENTLENNLENTLENNLSGEYNL